MKRRCARRVITAIIIIGLPCLAAPAAAQVSKSLAVAKDLTAALDAKKMDAIAAKIPGESDRYVAALYFPGVQLLVIAGKYPQPALMDPRIGQKQYRDIYTELSGTIAKESKIFVLDMGVPGLTQKRDDGFFDTWTQGDKQVVFNGDWDSQKISEGDYNKTFTEADSEYTKMLSALLAEAKK
jgi:hypothetical protein